MAENKKGFVLYADQIEIFEQLPDDKAGQLIKHIYNYVNDKNPQTDDLIIKIAFAPIKSQLKRDLVKYEEKREKNRDNILKRWNKDNTTVYDRIPTDTKHTVIVKDKVKDKVTVKGKVKKEEIPPPTLDEFSAYAILKKSDVNMEAVKFKYESWIENGWKDGHGKEITNWKSKLLNTLPYLKEASGFKSQDQLQKQKLDEIVAAAYAEDEKDRLAKLKKQ